LKLIIRAVIDGPAVTMPQKQFSVRVLKRRRGGKQVESLGAVWPPFFFAPN